MEKLRQQLDDLTNRLTNAEEFRERLENLKSVYPCIPANMIFGFLQIFVSK